MKRSGIFLYGILSYAFFLVVFLAFIDFLGNFILPKTIDSGTVAPLGKSILINVGLIALFGIPHSIMARQSFKRWWTRFIPPAAERSAYVLQSSVVLALLMVEWRPIPQLVWYVENEVARNLLWGLFGLGWAVVLVATFLISHFELFGLQQVSEYIRQRPISEPGFKTPGLYKLVRHPLQLGLAIAFWATPEMSVGHALFAIGMTIYMLIGLDFEERALIQKFGERYRTYQSKTPRLIPGLHLRMLSYSLETDTDRQKGLLNYHPHVLAARLFTK